LIQEHVPIDKKSEFTCPLHEILPSNMYVTPARIDFFMGVPGVVSSYSNNTTFCVGMLLITAYLVILGTL